MNSSFDLVYFCKISIFCGVFNLTLRKLSISLVSYYIWMLLSLWQSGTRTTIWKFKRSNLRPLLEGRMKCGNDSSYTDQKSLVPSSTIGRQNEMWENSFEFWKTLVIRPFLYSLHQKLMLLKSKYPKILSIWIDLLQINIDLVFQFKL